MKSKKKFERREKRENDLEGINNFRLKMLVFFL